MFFVVTSVQGRRGYLAYRVKNDGAMVPWQRVRINDLVADDANVYAASWRYLLDIDLAGSVTAWGRPIDEPARWLLKDPRRLRTTIQGDFLWTRIVDVPAALAGRRYGTDGDLVLEVTDDFLGFGTGRFALSGSPTEASCKPAKKKADISLSIADLGAIHLGGHAPSALARVGRVESTPRAPRPRRALFGTHRRPSVDMLIALPGDLRAWRGESPMNA